MSRVVIIGQAPSRLSDPREPLSGNSGRRLAALSGLTTAEFLDRFERRNLLDAWPGKAGKGDKFAGAGEARALAESLRAGLATRRVVLLGTGVARAFGFPGEPFLFGEHWEGSFAMVPHPSGTNRWWNDRERVAQAQRFWSNLATSSHLSDRG